MTLKKSLISTMVLSALATTAFASSHREAPAIAQNPTVDSTDFYVFNSYEAGRDEYVTLIANYIPLQDAYGGPNYFAMNTDAHYAIHIDSDGDAVEDISFVFDFDAALGNAGNGIALEVGPQGDTRTVNVPLKNVGGIGVGDSANANFFETYTLTMVQGDIRTGTRNELSPTGATEFAKPLDFIGTKTFASVDAYKQYSEQFIYSVSVPGCDAPAKVFVGQRKDPFVVALGKTFDLVNYVPVEGDSAPGAGDGGGFPGGITQNDMNDDLRDKNVTSLAIEIHKSCVTGDGNGVIGAWTTASLPQADVLNPNASFDKPSVAGGAMTQVSRLSNPLVNELVIGLGDKNKFSTSSTTDDAQFINYVTHPTLPELLNLLFKDAVNDTANTSYETLAPTNFPRNDLVAAFLTGFEGVNRTELDTAAEMLRLNTAIPAVPAAMQSPFGVAGDDLAGFPNGRRPGDDVVDIALRVVMGALCHPIPVNGTPVNLGLCEPEDANVGTVPFTDGAPLDASYMMDTFPYVATPLPGSN